MAYHPDIKDAALRMRESGMTGANIHKALSAMFDDVPTVACLSQWFSNRGTDCTPHQYTPTENYTPPNFNDLKRQCESLPTQDGNGTFANPFLTDKSILCISDLHLPYEHPDALAFLKHLYSTYQCDYVVCIGDELDAHALSRFPHDPDMYSAGHECKLSIEKLEKYYEAFPRTLVCESNHTVRAYKKAREAGIPEVWLKSYREALYAPEGWEWRPVWYINGIMFVHGDELDGGQSATRNAPKESGINMVHGHVHSKLEVIHMTQHTKKPVWGMDCGCLVDPAGRAMAYASKSQRKVVIGTGVIERGKRPIPCRMELDAQGRWTGEVV